MLWYTLNAFLMACELIAALKLDRPSHPGYDNPQLFGVSDIRLGEPLNVIVSNHSSPDILTWEGFQNYYRSINFDDECMGAVDNAVMYATINGPKNAPKKSPQAKVVRQYFPKFDNRKDMSCHEIFYGGNHFRCYQQSTSHAWFLAASVQRNLTMGHNIIKNGYDKGREAIVSSANVTGMTSYKGVKYKTDVKYVTGLIRAGEVMNHNIAVDGRTAILTVTSSKV